MSEQAEQAISAAEQGHRYDGGVAYGDPHQAAEIAEIEARQSLMTDAEREHNRRVFGETYRERTGQTYADQRRAHARCVSYCLTPGQKSRGTRCPSCYGPIEIRAIDEEDIEPCPTRAERLSAWIGGWVGAFCDALLFPFRVGRAHTEAMIRDILHESSMEIDGIGDILTVLEGIEGQLLAIRNAAEGER